MSSNLDRAVQAAAEALHKAVCRNVPCVHQGDSFFVRARIAVEAAAPYITQEYNKRAGWEDAEYWKRRAERAEAEVERLKDDISACNTEIEQAEAEANNALRRYYEIGDQLDDERMLADRLAAALREMVRPGVNDYATNIAKGSAALVAYDEARRS